MGVDLDLANENFEVLGLRLDILFSNSRICYLSVHSSIPHLVRPWNRYLRYRMSVHHMPVTMIRFLEIDSSGQVIIYSLLEYRVRELGLFLVISTPLTRKRGMGT